MNLNDQFVKGMLAEHEKVAVFGLVKGLYSAVKFGGRMMRGMQRGTRGIKSLKAPATSGVQNTAVNGIKGVKKTKTTAAVPSTRHYNNATRADRIGNRAGRAARGAKTHFGVAAGIGVPLSAPSQSTSGMSNVY